MTTPDTPPLRAEVEDQLRHMLASPRFRNAPNPSAFLALVTQRKLRGKKTTGHVVANALFKEKFKGKEVNRQPPDVRVTAVGLRKLLAKYYAAEGCNDLVVIALPKPPADKHVKLEEGAAYTPAFSYNLSFFMIGGLRFAYVCLERWTFTSLRRAFTIFSDLLEKNVSPIGPTLGLVETHCKFEYRGWYTADFDWFSLCCRLLDELPDEAQNYWRYWAVRGAVYVIHEEPEKAEGAFDKALTLNRAQTEIYEHYIYFLITTGMVDKGITLANRYLDENLSDGYVQALFAFFLILAKRWDAGRSQLQMVLQIDPANCCAHELLLMVHMADDNITAFTERMRLLKVIYDEESYAMMIRYFVSNAAGLGLSPEIVSILSAEASACAGEIVKP